MKNALLIAAFICVVLGPLLLREKSESGTRDAETLVIITPHNEATRYEFGRAFDRHVFTKTGRHVHLDWRTPGGASEIARYLASEYLGAFENYWVNTQHRPWSAEVESSFDNPRVAPGNSTGGPAARQAFLSSNVGCGIDLFFGGGSFDFIQQASAGRLVDCGIVAAHPELFNPSAIPQNLGGEPMWDPQGRWIGACLGAFGICYNADALSRLNVDHPPARWDDLGDPHYSGQIALADPTQSGSVAKAFEMLIQQQMAQVRIIRFEHKTRVTPNTGVTEDLSTVTIQLTDTGETITLPMPSESRQSIFQTTVAVGWTRALQLIQRISANARYFTDAASKIPFDVEMGDAAAGMCIDFYGRFQSEFVRKANGTSRLQYVTPAGGSSAGADPIGLLRGAPHPKLAREFIEFVLSPDGQKLWNFKSGTPGGPEKYALRRLPILPQLYAPEFAQWRSDPEVNPYSAAGEFVYHEAWTGSLFRVISFLVKQVCIDPHDELEEAWQALIAAHFPPEATKTFHDLSTVSYEIANGSIRDTLRSPRKIEQVRLAKELSDHFRAQYRRAAELARAGK